MPTAAPSAHFSSSTHTVQDPSQAMGLPTAGISPHLSERNQDNPTGTSKACLPGESDSVKWTMNTNHSNPQ